MFEGNQAGNDGGAIYYNLQRPTMSNITYLNNVAQYGPNIGSYGVKIVNYTTDVNKLHIENVWSGNVYDGNITVALVDYDGQVMNLENDGNVKITNPLNSTSVKGTNLVRFKNGVASFNNLIFVGEPGSKNVEYDIYSATIDQSILQKGLGVTSSDYAYKNILFGSFSFCKPGEMETDGTCIECGYGSYSFLWNSTRCEN